MALSDEVSFDIIERYFGLKHGDVIRIMRTHISPRAFRNWRRRSADPRRNLKKHRALLTKRNDVDPELRAN